MPKAMIFLFDGTANDATQDLFSNVYSINQLIADQKRYPSGKIKTQVTFYLPGVGTKFTVRKGGWPLIGTATRIGQYLFGDGVEQMILRAYVNLSANYHPDDEIVLLGFSRGSVAARIFSRLISDFGILASDMLLHLDKLWNEFVEISSEPSDVEYFKQIAALQTELAHNAGRPVFHKPKGLPIRFLGVFDTVAGPRDNDVMKNIDLRDLYPARGVQHVVHLISMHEIRKEFALKRFDRRADGPATLREIWVPGVHSDVGGGYLENFISNVSLLTMADLLEKHGGIALDKNVYVKIREEMKEKVRNGRLVINAEPSVRAREKREKLVRAEDEIHPLHFFLLNKNVIWKNDQSVTVYQDRIRHPVSTGPLQQQFKRWVSVRGHKLELAPTVRKKVKARKAKR